MDDSETTPGWSIGTVQLQRVPYFDTPLPAESIDLEGVADTVDWAEPWLSDGQPAVGQAFWVIRSADKTIVVDPCGASDPFLRTGPEAIDHQQAAFAQLRAAGCEPDDVDVLVLTHLDGIGMAALVDGAPAGEEGWSAAFPKAQLLIAEDEYDDITTGDHDVMGTEAFAELDDAGAVRTVEPPTQIAPGVTLRQSGAHSPGHCCVEIESGGERAVLIGHLAISPLHAAVGVSANHRDPEAAWIELRRVLDDAARDGALVTGSLWPSPGAARVVETDPYVLVPAEAPDISSQ